MTGCGKRSGPEVVQAKAPGPGQENSAARELAVRRLSVREYGSGEMLTYLKRKGVRDAIARQVVDALLEEGLIDNERYARVIARHQAFRDKGADYVRMKLRQKGVLLPKQRVREIFVEALPESVSSELELARRVIERRYPKATGKARAKAYAALVRRGFSREVIQLALGSGSASSEDPQAWDP